MTIKATKELEGLKTSVTVSSYTSGAPVAPAAGHVSVYVDATGTDQDYRRVEITNNLQMLRDRAREVNYTRPDSTTVYFRVPIGGSKADIEVTTTSTAVVAGDVAIGFSASVLTGNKGSLIIDTCCEQLGDFLREAFV
jgi:hypothetical protein